MLIVLILYYKCVCLELVKGQITLKDSSERKLRTIFLWYSPYFAGQKYAIFMRMFKTSGLLATVSK